MAVVLGLVSSASAATTLKKLARSPFYRPGVTSAADLATLVKNRTADLKTGFEKAGNPEIYPAFMEQFPKAAVLPVKVAPGETFKWMLFMKKKNNRVAVLKDVTWKGVAPFQAYRFTIDKDGKRDDKREVKKDTPRTLPDNKDKHRTLKQQAQAVSGQVSGCFCQLTSRSADGVKPERVSDIVISCG